MSRPGALAGLIGLVLLASTGGSSAESIDPDRLVRRLAENGPRVAGSPSHWASQEILLTTMERAGLVDVARLAAPGGDGWTHLTGALPGRSGREILLTAHFDSVAGSSGALDNASGCAVVLAAASRLASLPRQHSWRVLLTDSEELEATGSRAWLATLPVEERRRMLADINVDMVGRQPSPELGIIHLVVGSEAGRRVMTPAWVVHAALRAAEAVDMEMAVLDPHWSWLAQLAVRLARPVRLSDGRRFLEVGVPSVTLSDIPLTASGQLGHRPEAGAAEIGAHRLESWLEFIGATLRRLDGLRDRPATETEYLVLVGRVWIRRDLVWLGFVLWVLLVWRGAPGSWRDRDAAGRRRVGRGYLPAFAFRMLFLVAVFLVPSFATLLLYPVGLSALVGRVRQRSRRQTLCLLASMPTLSLLTFLTVGQLAGWFVLELSALAPLALVLLTLATFCAWQLDEGVKA